MTVAGERDGARGSGRAQFARALHGAGTPVLGPMDGAHERTTRQSCDELPVHFADSVCGAAVPWRCFELTGQVTPIHGVALVDLVGRVPGAPPEQPTGSQPTTSLLRAGRCMPPVGPRMAPRAEVTGHRA